MAHTNLVLEQKASVAYVEAVLSLYSGGGVKDVFYSLAALNAAHPNGALGPMLVYDTSHVDGEHQYTWVINKWKDIGVFNPEGVADFSLDAIKLKVTPAYIHANSNHSIVINTTNKTVSVTKETFIVFDNNNATIPIQSASYANNIQPSWVQHVYYDNASKALVILNSGSVPNQKLYYLFSFYSGAVVGGNKNVVIDGKKADAVTIDLIPTNQISEALPNGKITDSKLSNAMAHVIGSDVLEINFKDRKIYVKKAFYVLKTRGFVAISATHPTVDFIAGYGNFSGTYKIYVDIYDGNAIKMSAVTHDSLDSPVLAIFYNMGIATESPHAIYGINSSGNVISKLGSNTGIDFPKNTSTFNWATNRFLLPKKLHLLTNVEYSITAQQFNYNRFKDEDSLLFEIISPTQTTTFENTANISSPFEVQLETRVGGIFNGNKEDALFKNVILDFKDPTNIVKNEPIELFVGDSITFGKIPSYVKWWLQKFGMNPTFIGTSSNSYSNYGLGIVPELGGTPGEGRGGWRLTDYTGTTKRTDGSTFIMPNNPFLNPETQAFDFTYYMNNNGYTHVDHVVFQLLTNDITNFHNFLEEETISRPSIEEVVAYAPLEYQKMIDSVHAFEPNIKIGINMPPLAGIDNSFNDKVSQITETLLYHFDEKQSNVYCLPDYLANGPITGKTHYDDEASLVAVSSSNDTKRGKVSTDVHNAETNIMVTSLYTASWIVNQS